MRFLLHELLVYYHNGYSIWKRYEVDYYSDPKYHLLSPVLNIIISDINLYKTFSNKILLRNLDSMIIKYFKILYMSILLASHII